MVGYSVAMDLFYNGEVGTVVGPLRGPDAYFIARINAKVPPSSDPNVKDERVRELVRQDYVQSRFMDWASEVVSGADFQ